MGTYQRGQRCKGHLHPQRATSAGETFVMMGMAMPVLMGHLANINNCLINERRIETLGSWEGHWEKMSVMPQRSWHGAGSLSVCHRQKQRLGIK
jgi:hypothetical protein